MRVMLPLAAGLDDDFGELVGCGEAALGVDGELELGAVGR